MKTPANRVTATALNIADRNDSSVRTGFALAFLACFLVQPVQAQTAQTLLKTCSTSAIPERAIEACTSLIEGNDPPPAAYLHRARAYAASDTSDDAAENALIDYTRAVEYLNGKIGHTRREIANPEVQTGVLGSLVATDTSEILSRVFIERGIVFARLEQYKRALEDFGRAMHASSNIRIDAVANGLRGDVQAKRGLVEEAIWEYTNAIKADSQFLKAFEARAALYEQSGQPDLAQKDRETARKIKQQNAIALYNRGLYHEKRGMLQEATADYRMSAQLGHGPAQQKLEEIQSRQ